MALWKPIATRFSANVLAGTGTVVQGTYTVPAGKRAQFQHSYLRINGNANAANTTFALCQATIAGVLAIIQQENGSGVAATLTQSYAGWFDLLAGDKIDLVTTNTGVNNVPMEIAIIVREYL